VSFSGLLGVQFFCMDRQCCLCGTSDNMLWYHRYTSHCKVQHYCSTCYLVDETDTGVCQHCQTARPLPFIAAHNRPYCLRCYRKRRIRNECLFTMPTEEKIIERLSHDDDAVHRLFVSLIKTRSTYTTLYNFDAFTL